MKSQNTYHLVSEHKDGFEREFALAVVEKILKTRSKQVNNHHIVVALDTEPVNVWNSDCIYKEVEMLKICKVHFLE